ncbi:hypothetical protein H5410_053507, partial [Solanum commersonii]
MPMSPVGDTPEQCGTFAEFTNFIMTVLREYKYLQVQYEIVDSAMILTVNGKDTFFFVDKVVLKTVM